MKKLNVLCILCVLLASIPTVLADSLTVETTINESIQVAFRFGDIEPQRYDEIKNQEFDVTTIPSAIEENFEQENLTNARIVYDLNQEIFNDDTHSISVNFLLAGSDIISYTFNRTDMTRTFRVRTGWRKIQIGFSQNFSLSLEEHFGTPLTEWQQANSFFEKIIAEPFEMSFRFTLPERAVDIQVEGDTIIFKVPPAFEDTLLNSPFLVLGAIIIANIVFVIYRKAKK